MKIKDHFYILAILCLLAGGATLAFAQGTTFTYQGRLTDGTNAANGNYDLRFYLRDALGAGNPVGNTNTLAPVTVSNGLFTVALDFGAGVFTGPARWLEIGVRTNGSVAAYATLAPRQALTATPYAILAGNSGNLGGQPSTAFAPVSGSSTYVAKAGDTMTGALNLPTPAVLSFGGTTRQMLSLYNSGPYNYGIGVQNSTFYLRAGATYGGFAWYQGGTHSDSQNDPGTNGISLMALDASGNLTAIGKGSFNGGAGDYGVNATGGFGGLHGVAASGYGVYGETTTGIGTWGASSGAGDGVYGSSSSGIGVHGRSTGVAGYFEGDVAVTGELTVGTSAFTAISGTSSGNKGVYGATSFAGPNAAGVWGANSANGGTAIVAKAAGSGSTGLYAYGTQWAGYFDGPVNVCTLTIRGGCDVAEPFEMSAPAIVKGSVVVIDDQNTGQLKLSNRAYDTRVAGIVSGANGINPGIALHQDGALEGGQNVALSGRVYVLADASNGAIQPGDLLTTSNTPGHAMKVTNHNQAQGATLGKAMSSLKQGRGMVLVLVTLQ